MYLTSNKNIILSVALPPSLGCPEVWCQMNRSLPLTPISHPLHYSHYWYGRLVWVVSSWQPSVSDCSSRFWRASLCIFEWITGYEYVPMYVRMYIGHWFLDHTWQPVIVLCVLDKTRYFLSFVDVCVLHCIPECHLYLSVCGGVLLTVISRYWFIIMYVQICTYVCRSVSNCYL